MNVSASLTLEGEGEPSVLIAGLFTACTGMRTKSREKNVTSVLPVVLATVLALMLARHPGGSAISGRAVDQARSQGHRGVGTPPRQLGLTSEAYAHLPDPGPAPALTGRRTDPGDPEDLHDLVDRAKAGDAEAFGQLFDHFHGPVFRQLFTLTRSRTLAEDLTSETFFKALRAMGGFALPSELFGPWLRRIARNLANDHFKASSTRRELVTSDLSFFDGVVDGPDDLLVTSLDLDALRDAMHRLPVNQRRALALRFLRERSITETAKELGCSEGAAKQLQWRGLRNLARLLRDGAG